MAETATRIHRSRLQRGIGLEKLVDVTAIAVAIIGCIVAVFQLFSMPKLALLAFLSTLATTFIYWLLLRCLAEHLRLQKRIAGLSFDGQITGAREELIDLCSNCGQMLNSDSRCSGCNAAISDNENEGGG